MHVTAIVAAGGAGRRLGAGVPKQMMEIDGRTILERSVAAFARHPRVHEVIVALPREVVAVPPAWLSQHRSVQLVEGGPSRQDSVAAAFDRVQSTTDIVLVHDAARPFVSPELIDRCIDAAAHFGGAIAALRVSDTVKRVVHSDEAPVIDATLERDSIYLAQTPQAFRRAVLSDAVALGRSGVEATDEAGLAERVGHAVRVVPGDPRNIKITTPADLDEARSRHSSARPDAGRVGIGYDLHRLADGRPLVLGGVTIPFEKGAEGHSDADVICHAVTDAILGAACRGDIGVHFPDTDPRWKGASSLQLLQQATVMVREAGFRVSHVDVVIVLERPKIAPFKDAIRCGVAGALGIEVDQVSVKGKTNEGVDAIGRGEAIAAHAVALIQRS